MKLTDNITPADLEELFNDLVMEWNRKVNLVSRKKTDVYDLIEDSKLFFDHINFRPGIRIMDLGTGGGFPGIVIKIQYPEIQLTVVDSIAKKIKAVEDIISKLGLEGIDAVCSRAEDMPKLPDYKNKFDYIVARSVAMLDVLVKLSRGLLKPGGKLVTLKGGDISKELHRVKKFKYVKNIAISSINERKVVVVDFGV
jgi:16S rRNA (guanine527-N7)-methyltransferase